MVVGVVLIEATGGDDEMDMRVSIEFGAEGMNNGEDTWFEGMFRAEEVGNGLCGNTR